MGFDFDNQLVMNVNQNREKKMKIEVDLDKVNSWIDFHDYFKDKYGFQPGKDGLGSWISNLQKITDEETLFVIKNPSIVYGDSTNIYRDVLLQMITVVNTERYANGQAPTIKVVFDR